MGTVISRRAEGKRRHAEKNNKGKNEEEEKKRGGRRGVGGCARHHTSRRLVSPQGLSAHVCSPPERARASCDSYPRALKTVVASALHLERQHYSAISALQAVFLTL